MIALEWIQSGRRLFECSELLSAGIFNKIRKFADEQNCREEIDYADASLFYSELQGLLEGYYLLIGYAVENTVKAISIQEWVSSHGNDNIEDLQFLKRNVWKVDRNAHSLTTILSSTAVQPTVKELKLLNSLEEYIIWAAKYPFPTNNKFIQPQLLSSTAEQVDDCRQLYIHLLNMTGWKSYVEELFN